MSSERHDRTSNRANRRPAPLSETACSKESSSPDSSTSPDPISPTTKRQRELGEIEGEGSNDDYRKKLRLHSEDVSPEPSIPHTGPPGDILSQGAVRPGIWSRLPLPANNPVMKAAILNSIRRDSQASKEVAALQLGLPRSTSCPTAYGPTGIDNVPIPNPSYQKGGPETSASRFESEVPASPSLSYTPNYDIFDDEDDSLDEIESCSGNGEDAYPAFEEDSDYDTLCPLDEVLIEHHHQPLIDSKPENSAIAKEIQLQLPSERLGYEPFF